MVHYREKVIGIMKNIADKNYFKFKEMGHAEPGNNGPYGHADTPARNTAHWLIIYSFLWKVTKELKYKEIASDFAVYLKGLHRESTSGAIICMYDNSFNFLNGLIGQAWVIEAILYFAYTFEKDEYIHIAEKIFLSQKYDYREHMWEMIELDGNNIGYDYTFNHQLWFAAVGSMFEDNQDIKDMVEDYLFGCKKHMQIYKSGLIKHYGDVIPKNKKGIKGKVIKRYIKKYFLGPMRYINPTRYDYDGYERAYHLFNLYALAILKNNLKNNSFLKEKKVLKAIEYGRNIEKNNDYFNVMRVGKDKFNCISMNKYAYSYNSPAFEFPYIYKTFGCEDLEKICEDLLQIQVEVTYDSVQKKFVNYVEDPETLTARIYELIRFIE